MNWQQVKDCIDTKKPFQSKGDKAIYYLELADNTGLRVEKYDADCVKLKLNWTDRIGDSFFRIINEKVGEDKTDKQLTKEKVILVETKGKSSDYFEQLEKSIDLFGVDYSGNVHGRFVGLNVPAKFKDADKKRIESLQRKFKGKKGALRFGNRFMRERILSFEALELRGESQNSKPELIQF